MSFTKWDKHLLTQRILADIPHVDYKALIEQVVAEICISRMPDQIRRIWLRTELRHHLQMGSLYYCCFCTVTPGFATSGNEDLHGVIASDPRFIDLHALHDEQAAARENLSSKLRNSFSVIKSVKGFGEQFPELVKYLRIEEPAVVNLPATSDVVDSLRAAGLKIEVDSPPLAT